MYLLLNRSFELIMLTASTTIGFTYMQTLVYTLNGKLKSSVIITFIQLQLQLQSSNRENFEAQNFTMDKKTNRNYVNGNINQA